MPQQKFFRASVGLCLLLSHRLYRHVKGTIIELRTGTGTSSQAVNPTDFYP
jgi:hypothetical protein